LRHLGQHVQSARSVSPASNSSPSKHTQFMQQ
jgi:hypothetical protein